jgi:hypothetical protein
MASNPVRSARGPWVSPIGPLLAFVCALEGGDESEARAAAQRATRDTAKILRAYVSAHFDNDASAAASMLAEVISETGVEALDWLRARTEARIQELKGETSAAQRIRDALERAIHDSGTPQPFWEARNSATPTRPAKRGMDF